MASPTLDDLPMEILIQTTDVIGAEHPPSLSSIALVSKRCHAATTTRRLRSITFVITTRQALRRDVDKGLEILKQRQSLKYVRRLEITGSMPATLQDEKHVPPRGWTLNDNTRYAMDEIFGTTESYTIDKDGPIEVLSEEDEAWLPLVELLQTLPHLKDFVFNCSNQFPPSLLQALCDYQTQCRLHISQFRFRSLHKDITDAHEMAIATSPCLYSIEVRNTWRDSRGRHDYNREAIKCLVGGLAPNLKRVTMFHCLPVSTIELHPSEGTPRKPWNGFSQGLWNNELGSLSNIIPASLESFTLKGYGPITSKSLSKWQECTSFSHLRHLNLEAGINGHAMQWAADNAVFPNLVELHIKLDRGDEIQLQPGFGSSAIGFFNSLLPLKSLVLSGSIDPEIFESVLERHGHTLRKMSLRPQESSHSKSRRNRPSTFTIDDVIRLQEFCPLLEELAMPVRRRKGNAVEVEMYRALGKMRRLDTLFLILDCSNPSVMLGGDETPNDPSFDESMQEFFGPGIQRRPRYGHVRDLMLNVAVNEALARSIWALIDAAKTGRRLMSLKLHTDWTLGFGFGSNSCKGDLKIVVEHLSRSYLLERSVRDDDDSFSVRELGRRAREARDEKERRFEKEVEVYWRERRPILGPALETFHRIWPAKEDSQDWREVWSSLPLQT